MVLILHQSSHSSLNLHLLSHSHHYSMSLQYFYSNYQLTGWFHWLPKVRPFLLHRLQILHRLLWKYPVADSFVLLLYSEGLHLMIFLMLMALCTTNKLLKIWNIWTRQKTLSYTFKIICKTKKKLQLSYLKMKKFLFQNIFDFSTSFYKFPKPLEFDKSPKPHFS